MQIVTLNIKENYPDVSLAIANLEIGIERLVKSNYKIIKVIHGYGSHGRGGEIKKAVHIKLRQLINENKIKNYIPGEMWGNDKLIKGLLIDYPELVLDNNLKNFNNGISVILL